MVKQKLLDFARDTLRRKHLSYRTKQAYIYWMRKFIWTLARRRTQFRAWLTSVSRREASVHQDATQVLGDSNFMVKPSALLPPLWVVG
jgi:hypothetical protein